MQSLLINHKYVKYLRHNEASFTACNSTINNIYINICLFFYLYYICNIYGMPLLSDLFIECVSGGVQYIQYKKKSRFASTCVQLYCRSVLVRARQFISLRLAQAPAYVKAVALRRGWRTGGREGSGSEFNENRLTICHFLQSFITFRTAVVQ